MNTPIDPAWQNAVREYRALDEHERRRYWENLTPGQRDALVTALQQPTAEAQRSAAPAAQKAKSGCARVLRRIAGLLIAPFVAATIASAFAQNLPEFAFYLALAVAYLAGLPIAAALVVVATVLRRRNPLWYLAIGAITGLLTLTLLQGGPSNLFGRPRPGPFELDPQVAGLLIVIAVFAGAAAGAAYFVIGEWTPGGGSPVKGPPNR